MSCLFNSMSRFLQLDINIIRQQICDYLQNNNIIIDGITTNSILEMEGDNYVDKMRGQSTWGGAIEIQAACNIWNLKVVVHNNRDNPHTMIEFLPVNNNNNITRIIELEWTGGHYEAKINN